MLIIFIFLKNIIKMSDKFNITNIGKGDYNFDTSKYFFNADRIRLVIIIFILINIPPKKYININKN
jgi:hypothetical protein